MQSVLESVQVHILTCDAITQSTFPPCTNTLTVYESTAAQQQQQHSAAHSAAIDKAQDNHRHHYHQKPTSPHQLDFCVLRARDVQLEAVAIRSPQVMKSLAERVARRRRQRSRTRSAGVSGRSSVSGREEGYEYSCQRHPRRPAVESYAHHERRCCAVYLSVVTAVSAACC